MKIKKFLGVLIILSVFTGVLYAKMEKDEVPVNPLMKASELVSQIDSDRVIISNVTWKFEEIEGKLSPVHKSVTIDASKVKEVYYISEKFKPEWIAAHGMILFVMENSEAIFNENGEKSNAIVLSVEAWRHEGVAYSILKGFGKNFKLLYNMINMDACIQLRTINYKHKLETYRLLLTKQQKAGLLRKVISEAVRDRTKEYYNTGVNSCVTNAVELIDKILEKDRKLYIYALHRNFLTYNKSVMLPVLTPKYLMKKKVAVASEIINPDNYIEIMERNYDLKDVGKNKQKLRYDDDTDDVTKEALKLMDDPVFNMEMNIYRKLTD